MFPRDLQLDALFEDYGVSWLVIEDMFALERATCVLQRNLLFQPDRGPTGKSALTSCKTSLPPRLSRPTVHTFLFSSWTLLTGPSPGCRSSIFIKMDQVPRHARPQADLLSQDTSPDITHRRCTQGTIQQIVTEEYRILEVLNFEFTTPTPAAWIEVFERRLSLWQEQQLQQPYHPHIPRAPAAVLADSAYLIAEAYMLDHPFTANSRASQVGASAWFISVALSVCMELTAARQSCHTCASPLLWLCHSTFLVSFVHFVTCSHWKCACHWLIAWMF